MGLQPRKHSLVGADLDLLRPEAAVVEVPAQPRNADADGVLGAARDAVGALGVILEAEHQLGQHLRVHRRQLIRPDLADHIAGRGGQSAALADFEGGLQRNGQRPARGHTGDVRLVNPSAGKVQTGRHPARHLLQRRR